MRIFFLIYIIIIIIIIIIICLNLPQMLSIEMLPSLQNERP